MAHRAKFTPARKERFLEELRKYANATLSAKAVGISRRAAYDHRASDPEFCAEWDDAVNEAYDRLEQEAYRRAHEGFTEDIYFQGGIVGQKQVYSDHLMGILLKGNRPEKYRDQVVKGTGPAGSLIIHIGDSDQHGD